MPLGFLVSPRDRERAARDARLIHRQAAVALRAWPWWLRILVVANLALVLGGVALVAAGDGRLGARVLLAWLAAAIVWQAISVVLLLRRRGS